MNLFSYQCQVPSLSIAPDPIVSGLVNDEAESPNNAGDILYAIKLDLRDKGYSSEQFDEGKLISLARV